MRKFIGVLAVALFTAFLFALCVSSDAFASVASVYTQPTGEKVEYFLMGDEFMPWLQDKDGNLLVIGREKFFEYGVWDLETGGAKSTGNLAAIDPATPESKVYPIPQKVFDAAQQRRIDFQENFGYGKEVPVEPGISFEEYQKQYGGGFTASSAAPPWTLPGVGDGSDISGRINDALIIYVTFGGPSLLSGDEALDPSYFMDLMYSPTEYRTYTDPRTGPGFPDRFDGDTFYGSVANYFYETSGKRTAVKPGFDQLGRGGVVHVEMPADWNRSFDIFGTAQQFGITIEARNNSGAFGNLKTELMKEVVKKFDFRPFATYNPDNDRWTVARTSLSVGLVLAGFSWETSSEICVLSGAPGFWAHSGGGPAVAVADLPLDYNGASLSISGMYAMTSFAFDRSRNYEARPRQFGVFGHELGHDCYGFGDTYDVQGYYRVNTYPTNFFERTSPAASFDITQPFPGTLMCGAFGNWGIQGTGGYIYSISRNEDIASRPSNQDARNWVDNARVIDPVVLSKDGNYTLNTGDVMRINATPTQFFYLQVRNNDKYDEAAFDWARGGRTLKSDPIINPNAQGWRAYGDSLPDSHDFWTAQGGLMIIHIDNDTSSGSGTNANGSRYALPAVVKEAHGGNQHMLMRTIQDRAMAEYDFGDPDFNMGDPADLFGNSVREFPVSGEPTHRLFAGIGYAATYIDANGDRKVSPDVSILADKRQREPSGPMLPFQMTNISYDQTSQSVSFHFAITVSPDIANMPDSMDVLIGQPVTIAASVSPDTYPGDKTIIWTSNNTSVATVTSAGAVSGVAPGFATITAALFEDPSVYEECLVYVPVQAKGVTLIPSADFTLNLGESMDIIATVTPSPAYINRVVFTNGAPSVASIDLTGDVSCVVTALAPGTTTITADAVYGATTATSSITVTVLVPVTGITVSPTSATILVGNTQALTATVTPSNATSPDVSWSTSAASIATVSPAGLVTGVNPGTAVITATTLDGGFIATCNVQVDPNVVSVTGVTLNNSALTMVMGTTSTLTETIAPSIATNTAVGWSSSNSAVATVSGGTVTAVSIGTATITVTTVDGGFSDTCAVTVVPIPVTPTYPTILTDVATDTGIAAGDLEVIGGRVYLKKGLAETIAKGLLGVNRVNTEIHPVFEATVAPNGGVAQISITVTGEELLALTPDEINLIGMTTGSAGDLFDYVNSASQFDANKFTLLQGGVIYSGVIDPNGVYELLVFIEDGGKFDLDGAANGEVIASIFFASERTGGGGGGCSAFGYLAFTLLAVPFVLKRNK